MACFTRSVVWRFWTAVLLLSDMLVHLVHAVKLEEHSAYLVCVARPATCVQLDLPQWSTGISLTGMLPTELGLLTAMTNFRVDGHDLSGTLPTELGLLTMLGNFNVANNNLHGTLPTEFASFTRMYYFEVYDNAGLCGPLVSMTNIGTTYYGAEGGLAGTDLGNPCPVPPPPSTASQPCCDDEEAWRDAYAARMVKLRARWANL